MYSNPVFSHKNVMSSYKQAIVIREDLNMSKGKMIAQGSHASLKAYRKAAKEAKKQWERQGEKKVVLNPEDVKLESLKQQAEREGLPAALVTDAGHTEVEPGTKTALAIGPAEEEKLDKITGQLELIN